MPSVMRRRERERSAVNVDQKESISRRGSTVSALVPVTSIPRSVDWVVVSAQTSAPPFGSPKPMSTTTTATAQNTWNHGFGTPFCQDFFFTCDHECRRELKGLTPAEEKHISSSTMKSAVPALPLNPLTVLDCFLPSQLHRQQSLCFGHTLVQLHGSNFSCIAVHPELLRPDCHKSCPKGYYPTCLLVKRFFDCDSIT